MEMRICFISRESVKNFRETYNGQQADLFVFGFNESETVSYDRELHRETTFFEEAVRLSKDSKACVVCGCMTDMRGIKRKSAVVADRGKLLGVSDMLYALDGENNSGGELRAYETSAGKIGLIIAEDFYFPEVARDLSRFGSEYIVCPFDKKTQNIHSVLLRAEAFFCGIPMFFCAKGYSMVADIHGELAFASPQSPICAEIEYKKEYHRVESRRCFCLPNG